MPLTDKGHESLRTDTVRQGGRDFQLVARNLSLELSQEVRAWQYSGLIVMLK